MNYYELLWNHSEKFCYKSINANNETDNGVHFMYHIKKSGVLLLKQLFLFPQLYLIGQVHHWVNDHFTVFSVTKVLKNKRRGFTGRQCQTWHNTR